MPRQSFFEVSLIYENNVKIRLTAQWHFIFQLTAASFHSTSSLDPENMLAQLGTEWSVEKRVILIDKSSSSFDWKLSISTHPNIVHVWTHCHTPTRQPDCLFEWPNSNEKLPAIHNFAQLHAMQCRTIVNAHFLWNLVIFAALLVDDFIDTAVAHLDGSLFPCCND